MLLFYHLHIFTVTTTLNQPTKNIFGFVSTQQVLIVYTVLGAHSVRVLHHFRSTHTLQQASDSLVQVW
jgi:hypothetical protein